MTSSSACMTDLEVILEFLDEHYKQEALERDKVGVSAMSLPHVVFEEQWALGQEDTCNLMGSALQPSLLMCTHDQCTRNGESQLLPVEPRLCTTEDTLKPSTFPQAFGEHPSPFGVSAGKALLPHPVGASPPLLPHTPTPGRSYESPKVNSAPAQRGRKLRLFHFLFEMLENPGMAHCVSWVPSASAGVFSFSSQNKERVAELWGRRKGNRRPMTYQKMSRALRNYAQSGEIVKVKKKLTYRFSCATLRILRSQQGPKNSTIAEYNQTHQLDL